MSEWEVLKAERQRYFDEAHALFEKADKRRFHRGILKVRHMRRVERLLLLIQLVDRELTEIAMSDGR